jgi:Peptidase family M23
LLFFRHGNSAAQTLRERGQKIMISSLVVAQVLVPIALIAWLAIAPPRSLLGVLLQALVTIMTLLAIDRFGWRAKGIAPSDLAAYQIYGEPVLAPCTGKIVQAIDGLPDMKIPQIDSVNRSGNHVILHCGDIDVLLAHFRPQSLSVQAGMDVQVGDRLAEVGNSGASVQQSALA